MGGGGLKVDRCTGSRCAYAKFHNSWMSYKRWDFVVILIGQDRRSDGRAE